MRFVYVQGLSGVLFCEHETRVKDYAAFRPTSSKQEEGDYPMMMPENYKRVMNARN